MFVAGWRCPCFSGQHREDCEKAWWPHFFLSLRVSLARGSLSEMECTSCWWPGENVEEVRGQLSDPALGWVDRRRRFQQGGAQGCWRRVAYTGSTRTRFWFHTTGASGLGEVLSSEANTPGCWPAMRSQMKATINGRRTFTFCESFLFVCFCSKSSVLEKESSDLKVLAKLQ